MVDVPISGQYKFDEFRDEVNTAKDIEELCFYGLQKEEIEFYIDYRKGEEYFFSKHKNLCKTFLHKKISHILQAIKNGKVNKNSHSERYLYLT